VFTVTNNLLHAFDEWFQNCALSIYGTLWISWIGVSGWARGLDDRIPDHPHIIMNAAEAHTHQYHILLYTTVYYCVASTLCMARYTII
jgi:hypothetical protein